MHKFPLIRYLVFLVFVFLGAASAKAQPTLTDPETLVPMPDVKAIKTQYSSGILEVNTYTRDGRWLNEKVFGASGDFLSERGFLYLPKQLLAKSYQLDGELKDTLITGRMDYDPSGRLLKATQTLADSPKYQRQYAYDSEGRVGRSIRDSAGTLTQKAFVYTDAGRLDSILVSNAFRGQPLALSQIETFAYRGDGSYIKTTSHLDRRETARVLYTAKGYRMEDLGRKPAFKSDWEWPNYQISEAKRVDSTFVNGQLHQTLHFAKGGISPMLIYEASGRLQKIIEPFPNTAYKNETYRRMLPEAIEEGKYAIGLNGDTTWLGSFRHQINSAGKVYRRVVFAKSPRSEPKEIIEFGYSDTTVTIITDKKGKSKVQRIELVKASLDSPFELRRTIKVWDELQDDWKILSEVVQDFDKAGNRIYYEDAAVEIRSTFNRYGIELTRELLSKTGDLPTRAEVELEFWELGER